MKEILDLLHQAGLSKSEAKIYVKLIERGTMRASELATASGVPRQNVYIAMESLMDKGFCIVRPGRVKKYLPVDPEIALENYREKLAQEKKIQQVALKKLSHQLRKIHQASPKTLLPSEYIEIIRGKRVALDRFARAVNNAKREIFEFFKPPYAHPTALSKEIIDAIQRGISFKYLLEADEWKTKGKQEILRNMREAGIQVRFVKRLPHKMVIFDSELVMLNFPDPVGGGFLTSLAISHSDFASMLNETFKRYWKDASP